MLSLGDIKWVKIKYSDSSVRVFRATIDCAIIIDVHGNLPDRDIYKDKQLIDGYLFDVKNEVIVTIPEDVTLEYYDMKPKFEREVDKYANSFI